MPSDKLSKIKHRSIDGKYGWIVVIAAALGFSLITGLGRVSGLIYVIIIDNYGVTRAKASTIFLTARLISFVSTPVTSKLVTKFTYSILICIGGLVLFLALLLSAFSTTLCHLIICYGALVGIGGPLVTTSSILAINTFFKKHRPLALSVYFTIGGASGLVIPLLYEMLLDKYQLSGAFLIYSAMCLNICCSGLLVRQPDWLNDQEKIDRELTRISEDETSLIKENEVAKIPPLTTNKSSAIRSFFTTFLNDISIFKDPVFLVLFICRILIMMPLLNVIQFLPDFVEKDLNLGISKKNIAALLSVTAIGDVLARILAGTVLHKLPWHTKYTYGALSASVGVFMFGILMVHSYSLLLAMHIIYGLLLGILNVMQYILEAELMGERTPLSFGITQSIGGIASVVMMLGVGYIRDITGSYRNGFYLMGVSGILSGLFWLIGPFVVRCLPSKTSVEKVVKKEESFDAV